MNSTQRNENLFRTSAVYLLACIFALFLQSTVFHFFAPVFPAPDLIVILVISVALRFPTVGGLFAVFIMGLLADFSAGRFLGPNAAGAVIVFLLTGAISTRVFADRIFAVMMIVFISDLVKSLTHFVMFFIYIDGHIVSQDALRVMLVEAVLTSVMSLLVLPVVSGLSLKFQRSKSERLRFAKHFSSF